MALTLNNNLKSLKAGDYFWCHYKTTLANTVGVFSNIATKTDTEATPVIPTSSSNLPNGYFRFIMVEDWNGMKRLIADRNIQHSISWDTLNTKGIASGSGLPMIFNGFNESIEFSIRLLTGGITAADTDNEWDRYIVSSSLGGVITAGDLNIWNWRSGARIWTSTAATTSAVNRTLRGSISTSEAINRWADMGSHDASSARSFRPVLEINSLPTSKSILLSNNQVYTAISGAWLSVGVFPSGLDERKELFALHGMNEITKDQANQLANVLPDGKGKIAKMEM